MEYPLSLAFVDFLPVLFAAVGFTYLVRLVSFVLPRQGRIALLGSILVVAGGLFKAVWKLLMAVSGGELDVNWMEEGLFILMAPGYILLAWSIWQTARSVQGRRLLGSWPIPLGTIVVTFLASWALFRSNPGSPAWERVLLSMMVLATVVTGILLIAFALRLRLTLSAGLFMINLLAIFLLNGMARLHEQPVAMQWVEEIVNAVSWLAFALGARMLYEYARVHFGVDDSREAQLTPMRE